jgi:hypothetical protein
MNILYIGPYLKNSLDGLCSRATVANIARHNHDISILSTYKHTIYAQPNDRVSLHNHKDNKNYQYVIESQHLQDVSINTLHKNKILIPTIDTIKNQNAYWDKSVFDQYKYVIAQSVSDYEYLKNILDNQQQKVVYIPIDVKVSSYPSIKYDIGLFKYTKNIFTVIDASSTNLQTILSLVKSFVYCTMTNPEISLAIYVISAKDIIIGQINNYSITCFKKLKMLHTINKVKVISVTKSDPEIFSLFEPNRTYIDCNTVMSIRECLIGIAKNNNCNIVYHNDLYQHTLVDNENTIDECIQINHNSLMTQLENQTSVHNYTNDHITGDSWDTILT